MLLLMSGFGRSHFLNWLEYTACTKRIKGESAKNSGNVPENELGKEICWRVLAVSAKSF
jgi:hypothetical protein